MTRIGQIIFSVLLLLIFIQVVIGFPIHLETSPDPEVASSEAISKPEQSQVMQKVHLVESREGNRDWELFADQATGSEGEGNWELQKVKVQFYSNSKMEFVVTGDKGRIDAATRDLKIEGNVRTKSANGYTFETSEIDYSAQKRFLSSRSKVQVLGPKDQQGGQLMVTGGQLESQVDAKEILIKNGVTARRILEKGRTFVVQSGRLKLSGQNTSAHFTNQVQIEVDSMRIEGPEAHFEYRTGTDFLRSVLIRGGVKVSDIDKYATAETVRFDPELNQFVLSGGPRLVQNQDELVGEQITFIDGGKKVKVESKK
jgi:LPS export ABC transporter protein LptC